jgi:hypothetical protein
MAANNKRSEAAALASDYLDSKARYVPDEFDGDRQFATTSCIALRRANRNSAMRNWRRAPA